jgi:hypothetical protein
MRIATKASHRLHAARARSGASRIQRTATVAALGLSAALLAAGPASAESIRTTAAPRQAAAAHQSAATLPASGSLLHVVTPFAVSCSYSVNWSQYFLHNGDEFLGYAYAGHYGGLNVVPSTTQVTSAGEEAQCLLKKAGYDPGTIDGVFGSHSQAAMHQFQTDLNTYHGAGLATGPGQDLPGPNSWKWLRWLAHYYV